MASRVRLLTPSAAVDAAAVVVVVQVSAQLFLQLVIVFYICR